jgi:hypothetical protein
MVSASPPGTHAWPGIVNLESWFWGTRLPDAPMAVVLDDYYRVTLYVVWSGRAHVTGPTGNPDFGDVDLGTVTIPEAIPYHVAEIRSVLRSRTASR